MASLTFQHATSLQQTGHRNVSLNYGCILTLFCMLNAKRLFLPTWKAQQNPSQELALIWIFSYWCLPVDISRLVCPCAFQQQRSYLTYFLWQGSPKLGQPNDSHHLPTIGRHASGHHRSKKDLLLWILLDLTSRDHFLHLLKGMTSPCLPPNQSTLLLHTSSSPQMYFPYQ